MLPGWIHGVLFLTYVGLLAWVAFRQSWPPLEIALAFAAAFVPFGTFMFERRLDKR